MLQSFPPGQGKQSSSEAPPSFSLYVLHACAANDHTSEQSQGVTKIAEFWNVLLTATPVTHAEALVLTDCISGACFVGTKAEVTLTLEGMPQPLMSLIVLDSRTPA